MKAGEVIELIADVDFVVKANWPLLMTQGIDCEPSLSLAISADKLLEDADVTFSVLPAFDQMVAIARMQNEPVWLDDDDVPVENGLFVPAGGDYEVARVPLPDLPSERAGLYAPAAGPLRDDVAGDGRAGELRADGAVVERLHRSARLRELAAGEAVTPAATRGPRAGRCRRSCRAACARRGRAACPRSAAAASRPASADRPPARS